MTPSEASTSGLLPQVNEVKMMSESELQWGCWGRSPQGLPGRNIRETRSELRIYR